MDFKFACSIVLLLTTPFRVEGNDAKTIIDCDDFQWSDCCDNDCGDGCNSDHGHRNGDSKQSGCGWVWQEKYKCCYSKTGCADKGIENSNVNCGDMKTGTTCAISCNSGYELEANGTLACNAGVYEYVPVCLRQVCAPFTYSLADDVQNCGSVELTNACTFDCASGYTTSTGTRGSATCSEQKTWSHSTCYRKPCVNPLISHSNGEFCTATTYGSSCTVTCDEGYTMSGSSTITCQEGPNWSSLPSCSESPCTPMTVANLESNDQACLTAGEASVTCPVTCQSGYELLEGDFNAVTCNFGQWSDSSLTCSAIPCDIPQIDNSDAGSACADLRDVGDVCDTIECADGYIFADTDVTTLTCTLGPLWTGSPACVLEPCATLEVPGSHTTCSTAVTDICEIECDEGYEIVGDTDVVQCQFGGSWSIADISCAQIPCDVPEIESSNYGECGQLAVGETCVLECNDGYEFTTTLDTILCEFGPELTTLPECVLVPCNALYIEFSQNSAECSTEVGVNCDIECLDGYRLIGENSVRCEFGGGDNWSQLPSCELIVCPNPLIDNSNAGVCEGTLASNYCSTDWECDEKYIKVQENEEHDGFCNEDGVWEELATCEQIFCPVLAVNNSNAAEACDGTPADSACPFTCDEDYASAGENTVSTCNVVGEWVDVSDCTAVVYCDPPTVQNSNAGGECASTQAGTLCQFTCAEDFDVEDGDKTIECGEFGEWVYLPNCTEVIVYGRLPETPIADGDMTAYNQLNAFLETAVNERLFELMGLEGADAGDIILNLAGQVNVYDFEDGSTEHANFFNRQPHADFKAFDDFYGTMLYSGLSVTELGQADQAALDNANAAKTQLLFTEVERVYGNLCADGSPVLQWVYAGDVQACAMGNGFMGANYQADVARYDAIISDLSYSPVQALRTRFEAHMGNSDRGDWASAPTSEHLSKTFDSDSGTASTFEYDITSTLVTEQSYVEEIARPGFAAYKNGQFLTVNYQELEVSMQVEMSFKKWANVYVAPGTWYDDSWQTVVLDPENVDDDFTITPEDEPDKTPLWGPDGLMNSAIRQLVVAREINITATGSSSFFDELLTIYQDADSVRFGSVCSGKACVETVNVVLDTTAPDLNTQISSLEDYLLPLVTRVQEAVFREDVTNSIAILGSSLSPNPGDYAGTLFGLSEQVGIAEENFLWYDGVELITEFFTDLQTGDVNPQIIWFTSDEFNGLDAEESQVLTDNAHIINNYTTSGGGLLAHGDPTLTYGWLQALLPSMVFEYECDNSDPEILNSGRLLLPATFSNEIVSNIPCTANFQNQFGNLEQLVADLNDKIVVLGAYGGITEGTSPMLDEDSNNVLSTTIIDNDATLKYSLSILQEENVVFAVYAPRFPNSENLVM